MRASSRNEPTSLRCRNRVSGGGGAAAVGERPVRSRGCARARAGSTRRSRSVRHGAAVRTPAGTCRPPPRCARANRRPPRSRRNGLARDGVAIAVDHGAADARVVRHELGAEVAGRPEVEQHQAPALGLVEVVREVRVGLHDAELEQLAEQQPLEQRADGIAPALRHRRQHVQRRGLDEVHRHDARRRQVAMHARHEQRRLVGDQLCESARGSRPR